MSLPVASALSSAIWRKEHPDAAKGRTNDAACFAKIERAAIAGERCPTRFALGQSSNTKCIARLIAAGKIKVALYGRNYRAVTLLAGEHAGKMTAPPPRGGAPWKIVDKDGEHVLRSPPPRRQQPSPPRPLSPANK